VLLSPPSHILDKVTLSEALEMDSEYAFAFCFSEQTCLSVVALVKHTAEMEAMQPRCTVPYLKSFGSILVFSRIFPCSLQQGFLLLLRS